MSDHQPANQLDPDFEALLNFIRRSRGFDFGAYKQTSLVRRLRKRMEVVGVDGYAAYLDYLEVHPKEFALLFDTILINVTNFFRDPGAWEHIETDVIPRILASKSPTDSIRVWSAGCASGEEAYTIAILLAEALGDEAFRERVKIYASDVDESALSQARMAMYPARDVAMVPPHLLEKYFEQTDQHYIFRKDLRRSIIFGRHDLLQDAPISRIDLLICRNVLMYFNTEAQNRVLSRFHFALSDTGFLFLGKAELLFTHPNLFTPVNLKRRVFIRVPKVNLRERLFSMAPDERDPAPPQMARHARFREAVFDAGPVALLVVDANNFTVMANERARSLFNLSVRDMGRALQDLDFPYRLPQIKPRMEEVLADRRPVTITDAEWQTASGDVRTLDIQLSPLVDDNGLLLGISIAFNDVTRYRLLREEIEHTNQELETAYEELQSTNEELETTNEELQSTVEELETTNEELQSTNEELETMNEELQSANEELQTINDELRLRTNELNDLNGFLESILTSIRGAVVVLDQDLLVKVWNQQAQDLWGLRPNEVEDKNFLNLDIGLPAEQLRQPIRACIAKELDYYEVVLTAVNRRGKTIQCHVSCMPLLTARTNDVRGVILVMDEVNGEGAG